MARHNLSQLLHALPYHTQAFLNTFLDNNVRPDGRLMKMCRKTTITKGVLTRNASGSSLVTLGSTQVMAATSLLVGTPAAASPQSGDLIVTSPQYSTWLQRVLRESGIVNLSATALCIVHARAAWRIQILVQVLNDDGNVRDAMLLAAVAALQDTILPKTVVDKNGIVHIVEDKSENDDERRLCGESTDIPIPLTVGFIRHDKEVLFLVDPSLLEEQECDSSCCMVVNTASGEIVNCELAGNLSISSQQLALVAQMAKGRAQELMELLK